MAIQPGQDGKHITFCRLCEALCGLTATVRDGRITEVGPDRDHPVSRGHLCVKAPGMLDVTYDDDRVLQPLQRCGGPGEFKPVAWEDALDDIAGRLDAITSKHGGNALGLYFGNPAGFSMKHYVYSSLFIASFGSSKFFNAMHVDTASRFAANEQLYGSAWRTPVPDLLECDHLLMFGANPLVSKMSQVTAPRALQQLDAIAKRGAIIVFDPRRTETARRYEHQPIRPDSDAWLLAGMLKTMIAEDLVDTGFLERRVNGWRALFAQLEDFNLDDAEARTGIPVERIQALAREFANARRAACYGRCGTNRGTFSTLVNVLMDAINLATGNFGVEGGSLLPWNPLERPGQAEKAPPCGARRSRIGDLPVLAGVQPGGTLADEILTCGEGQIRALLIDSGNPVLSHPDGDKTERAFDSLEFCVGLDLYVNESNRFANYILPTPTFFERDDFLDLFMPYALEPCLQYSKPVIEPLGQTRLEFDIYSSLLARLKKPSLAGLLLGQDGPPETREDCSLTDVVDHELRHGPLGDCNGADGDGLSIGKLRDEFPHGMKLFDRTPAERSFDQVLYADSKPRLHTPLIASELDRLRRHRDKSPGLRLFGRRFLHGLNSWMHNSDRLIRNINPKLLMCPDDAEKRQIRDGNLVCIRSKTGQLEAEVEISNDVVPGSICYPHGFGHHGGWRRANAASGENINLLASSDPADFEPVSGSCMLDGIPVEVSVATSR